MKVRLGLRNQRSTLHQLLYLEQLAQQLNEILLIEEISSKMIYTN